MDNTDEFHKQITELVNQARQYQPDSPQRKRYLTKIIRLIQASNLLWRESTPYYEDALQQTWVYFCQNICEAKTAKQPYDPNRSQITTWLNAYLKRRLQDFYNNHQSQKRERFFTNDENLNPIDWLKAPPDIPPILEQLQEWAEGDEELKKVHIRGRKDITCQILILRRLPPESGWKELSQELGVTISTLSTFYERQCRPRLLKFTEQLGY